MLQKAIEILEKLVSIPSISGKPTKEIVDYIKDYLESYGVEVILSFDETKERANVFASFGPRIDGGVLLNGHTDVVPVEGQKWSTNPFKLTRKEEKLHGRGAVDMKGFLACVLACVPHFQSSKLLKPIYLAFTFDEETGGFGVPYLLEKMKSDGVNPDIVIVGEPTDMKIVTSHKGGDEMRTEIIGHEVHSCDPTKGVSAINIATKLINKIEEIGVRLASNPYKGSSFDPPYSTFNVGTIHGGTARNSTSGWCNFDWEFRPMPGENSREIISEIENYADKILLPQFKTPNKRAEINIITEISVPPLDDRLSEKAASFVSKVTGRNSREVVSFGTDAGYFSDVGYSTVVCGPGSISRAHAPDEYITLNELNQGLVFIKKTVAELSH